MDTKEASKVISELGRTAEALRPQALAAYTPAELDAITAAGKRKLQELDEMNSSYPATKAFLTARGLTKVSQLDAVGRHELEAHLLRTLADLLNPR